LAYAAARTTPPTKPSKDQVHHPCPNKPPPPSSIDQLPVNEQHDLTKQENPALGMLFASPNSHNTTQQHLHQHQSITQMQPTTSTCSFNDEELLLPTDFSLLVNKIQIIVQQNIKVIKDYHNATQWSINPSPTNLPNTTQPIDMLFQHSTVTPASIDSTTNNPDTCFPATKDNYRPNKFTLEMNTASTNCNSFQPQQRNPHPTQ